MCETNTYKITGIKPVKRNRKVFSVYFNNTFLENIHIDLIEKYDLRIDNEISPVYLEKIIKENNFTLCLNDAFRYLGYKARTMQEMESYLRKKKHDEISITSVLAYLSDRNFLNDEEYCKAFIREKVKLKLWGPVKLRNELIRKGINQEIISKVLKENLNEKQVIRNLEQLIRKKLGRKRKLTTDEKNRLYLHCLRMGYESEMIVDLFNRFLKSV